MAPSSLKKMSEFRERKEGNYASIEDIPLGRLINCDLGLTLLPGSQIQRKDERRSGTTAESSPKGSGSRYVGKSEQWKSFETEIQQKHAGQEKFLSSEAKSLSIIPDPGPESAKASRVTARRNRERPFSQSVSPKDGSEVVQHNITSVAASLVAEKMIGTGKIANANNCQHDDSSPRAMKRMNLGSRAFNGIRDLKVSKGKGVTFETHYNRSHVRHDQDLSEINAVLSKKTKASVATIGVLSSGTRGDLGSSKPESRRQTTHSPDTALAHSHQSTILDSEDIALPGSPSALAFLTSKSPAKYQRSELDKLTVHYQFLKPSKCASAQRRKHSRLFAHNPAEIRTQVLRKPRSWTSHFPAGAKISRRANLPAPSLPTASFTLSKDHQHPHPINALLKSTNLHAFTHFLSTHPSPSLPSHHSLSKAFIYPLEVCALENSFNTAPTGNQCELSQRRSASMPNLSSTCAPTNMDSSNNFELASMPTPPREQPSSSANHPCSGLPSHHEFAPFRQNLVDTSFNADNSSSQDWQFNSDFQRQREYGLSERQSIGFTSNLHPRQVLTEPPNLQDMTALSVSQDEAVAAGRPQYSRRRLELKSNYSHEEVKSLMFNSFRQVQTLRAENTSLQSLNAAMKKGFERLQHGKADMVQRIQYCERIIAQKDQQIEAMRQKGSSLQHQYKQLWDEYNGVLATIRKPDGTGNPSAMAKRIRRNHSPNAVGGAGQGSQPSANASQVYYANGAQLPIPRHRFEQIPTRFEGTIQPVSIPAYPEGNSTNVSNRSLHQQGYTVSNHSNANPSQIASIPTYSEVDVGKASSQALSQPGFPSPTHDNANSPQSVSILAYPEPHVANPSSWALLQPGFAAANHNNTNSSHEGSPGSVPSNQPLDATVRTVPPNGQHNNRPTVQVPMERVTIDLTDDSRPPSSSVSCDTSVHQTPDTSVQGGYLPLNLPPAYYPAGYCASSQYPSGSSARNQMPKIQIPPDQDLQVKNLEAMRIQKEAVARMAKKPLSWLQGGHPFRNGTEANSRQPLQSNVEETFFSARSPEEGSVAPLPETVTGRKTNRNIYKKKMGILDAEAKRERAKCYRKNAAEKKKREKEIAKHLLHDEIMSNNAMRAQKQDRRAAKGGKRQEQAREEFGPREPQKTLDGRLYRDDTSVQQSMQGGSMEQAASDDQDSLFGDSGVEDEECAISPDTDTDMHEVNAATTEQDREAAEAAFAAQIEAELEADVNAGRMAGYEQGNAANGQTDTALADGDDGFNDFPSESEESEEE